jgi:hypothetical protein
VDSRLDALIHKARIAIQIQSSGRLSAWTRRAYNRYGNCVLNFNRPEASSWSVLVCDWPHSVWTKSLVCKDTVLQGIPLFRSISEDSALLASLKISGSLSAVRMLICPLFHPSGRRTIPSGRPNRPSIIRPDNVDFHPDPLLYREAYVPACIRPDISAARPDASEYSTKLQILSK